jgi:hypothetical protein
MPSAASPPPSRPPGSGLDGAAGATIVDEDASLQRLVTLLRNAEEPLTIAEIGDAGISQPAVSVYELELAGYEVDRVRRPRRDGAPVPAFRLSREPPRTEDEEDAHPPRRSLARLRHRTA